MTANNDYQDFTTAISRLTAQLGNSPAVSTAAGWNSATFTFNGWERSVNLLVVGNTNVITLSVTGSASGFVFLNAVPAYDGGIYYIPAMPVIDSGVTISWYQVTTASVTIYAVGSDEPLAHAVFNPVTPTEAISEHLLVGFPQSCPANVLTTVNVAVDRTTKALRCTVDNPLAETYGKIVGASSGTTYYDGSSTNTPFPSTPIPIDNVADTHVNVILQTTAIASCNLYVAAVNVPDYAGNTPLVKGMQSNELAPDSKQSELPNQIPVKFDGTVAASGTQSLVAAVAGRQYRAHQLLITQATAVGTDIDIEDTIGVLVVHIHWSTTLQSQLVPLYGQILTLGAGIQLHNQLAAATATIGVTLWYSVL